MCVCVCVCVSAPTVNISLDLALTLSFKTISVKMILLRNFLGFQNPRYQDLILFDFVSTLTYLSLSQSYYSLRKDGRLRGDL